MYKTLDSYYNNDPWDREEEHPDGYLWLVTVEEFDQLPSGTILEDTEGKTVVKDKNRIKRKNNERGYMNVGIRGIKND